MSLKVVLLISNDVFLQPKTSSSLRGFRGSKIFNRVGTSAEKYVLPFYSSDWDLLHNWLHRIYNASVSVRLFLAQIQIYCSSGLAALLIELSGAVDVAKYTTYSSAIPTAPAQVFD